MFSKNELLVTRWQYTIRSLLSQTPTHLHPRRSQTQSNSNPCSNLTPITPSTHLTKIATQSRKPSLKHIVGRQQRRNIRRPPNIQLPHQTHLTTSPNNHPSTTPIPYPPPQNERHSQSFHPRIPARTAESPLLNRPNPPTARITPRRRSIAPKPPIRDLPPRTALLLHSRPHHQGHCARADRASPLLPILRLRHGRGAPHRRMGRQCRFPHRSKCAGSLTGADGRHGRGRRGAGDARAVAEVGYGDVGGADVHDGCYGE